MQRLGNHVVFVFPLEDVRVGQVIGLFKDNLPVFPAQSCLTGSQPDLTEVGDAVLDLKEHVPVVVLPYHKRIGDKNGWYVRYVVRGENRVLNLGRGRKRQRRMACEDTDLTRSRRPVDESRL